MLIKNEIANVWCIEDNELENKNKVISRIVYDGLEIAILKTKQDWAYADMLIKDKNNIYWELGIAPIDFNRLKNGNLDNQEIKKYCDDIKNTITKMNFEQFFQKKIDKSMYFNKCELQFIATHYPILYEKSKQSREKFLNKREQENAEERKKLEKANNEKVSATNEIFESKIAEMKMKIHLGDIVKVEELRFYKNNDYYNGETYQNNILYLAKQYKVNIPLATQGYINNRLVEYNFGTGVYSIKRMKNNNNPSTKIRECLEQIKDKIDEEYKRNKEKTKIEQIKGVVR